MLLRRVGPVLSGSKKKDSGGKERGECRARVPYLLLGGKKGEDIFLKITRET